MRMYNFFRVRGSSDRCFWLAIIIKGRSHDVKINSGVERGSEKKVCEHVKPTSSVWLSVIRIIKLISKLWIDGLIQIIEFLENHVRGASSIVGKIIFSIVKY